MTIANNQHRGYFGFTCLTSTPPPRKYPVLTPEELKAVKWLVEGGFTRLKRINGIWEMAESEEAYLYLTSFMPTAKCLRDVAWLTETPINLKELLEAQEDV